MHYICAQHTDSTYISKFQVNTIRNIEVIRQNVFSHARVMVIGVSSDLKVASLNDHNTLVISKVLHISGCHMSRLPFRAVGSGW